MYKVRIKVSPEMWSFVGTGPIRGDWPRDWVVLRFDPTQGRRPISVTIGDGEDDATVAAAPLLMAVHPKACDRLFATVPEAGCTWHLPGDLRALAASLLDCPLPAAVCGPWRVAKSIELFCTIMTRLGDGVLVPAHGGGDLSEGDAVRILAARRLVDDRWREKLTLDAIARACGLNRAKLTRGFRLLFDCSVADALAENRLGGAHRLLRETDLPVSSIGYACGYGNNASFTRAFSRRFGMAPTRLRRIGAGAGT